MKVLVLWVAWGAVTVMAVVVLVAAFAATRASDPVPCPFVVVTREPVQVVTAAPGGTAVPGSSR